MFWKPKQVGGDDSKREAQDKERVLPHAVDAGAGAVEVASLTAALWELDAQDWRGDYFGWFPTCHGLSGAGDQQDGVCAGLTDPVYAADERPIGRELGQRYAPTWRSILRRLCTEGHQDQRAKLSLSWGTRYTAKTKVKRQPTRNWQSPHQHRL